MSKYRRRNTVNGWLDWLMLVPLILFGCIAAVGIGAAAMIKWAVLKALSKD